MSAFKERIKNDLKKLGELERSTGGKVRVVRGTGNPTHKLEIELDYPTAPSDKYPGKKQKKTLVDIELLSRYPLQEPKARILTPIFHPNVYTSGQICFGTKWLPTEGLELLVHRIIRIITFDPTIVNESSPANSAAASWYRDASARYPSAFPTCDISGTAHDINKASVGWKNIETEASAPEKLIIKCPECSAKLRVPKGKSGYVKCPTCKKSFSVTT